MEKYSNYDFCVVSYDLATRGAFFGKHPINRTGLLYFGHSNHCHGASNSYKGRKMMRKPELERDYVLLQAYKCWHCDFYAGFSSSMVDHIEKEHPESLD